MPTSCLWQLWQCWASDNLCILYFASLFLKAWNYLTRWWQQSVYVAKVDTWLWKWVNIYIVGRSNSFRSRLPLQWKFEALTKQIIARSLDSVRQVCKNSILFMLYDDILFNWLQLWKGHMWLLFIKTPSICVLIWVGPFLSSINSPFTDFTLLHFTTFPSHKQLNTDCRGQASQFHSSRHWHSHLFASCKYLD